MPRLSENETRVSLAVTNSKSLRTTIPIHIARKMGLEEGDSIMWDLDKLPSETWIGKVKKK